ncbi:hypothetical protein PG993_004994 [Apiospora rasikravindrae]|uniref:Uncharacterized protein n=1 Tax=Apiospora rasikravindrae TaxID=990691 RepID=A0ABR1TEC8_9PEZI
MRLPFILVWLYATTALASTKAMPWEIQYFYSIYKIEWKVHGANGPRVIAHDCKHDANNWKVTPSEVEAAKTKVGGREKYNAWNAKRLQDQMDNNAADEAQFLADAAAEGMEGICTLDEFAKHMGSTDTFKNYEYERSGHKLSEIFPVVPQ